MLDNRVMIFIELNVSDGSYDLIELNASAGSCDLIELIASVLNRDVH